MIGPLSQLRPTVNFASLATASPGQTWGPRTIPDCQFLYVVSGQAVVDIGPETYYLHAGDGVFYGSGSPHRIEASRTDPCRFCSIHFSWDKPSPQPVHPYSGIRECTAADLSHPPLTYRVEVEGYVEKVVFPHYFSNRGLEHLFVQISREYQLEEYGYTASMRGMLIQLITTLLRQQIHGRRQHAARHKIEPALEAIRKEPGYPWKTAELADLCGYHPTYFAAVFREVIGQAPKHFIVLERIRKAKQLLLEAMTVEEVAERLGYASTHYFCRNFKTVTGLTPTEYRKWNTEI